ncbi:START-like domain-containing protein [Porphyromonas macacae]|uniref:START-like domain-containing protein n=1 Tax=Porphyromonas macacae TaxID=28115 RepID=UPI0024AC97EC|nr:START-like domain-containing protein [Porphyromonas macacae]
MIMQKEKFHLEYVFDNVTQKSLWRHLSTPSGLEEWFANHVKKHDEQYTFDWGQGHTEKAVIISREEGERIRFQWKREETNSEISEEYFEFAIHNMELTGGKALEITDFATEKDRPEIIELWDNQIQRLRASLGV